MLFYRLLQRTEVYMDQIRREISEPSGVRLDEYCLGPLIKIDLPECHPVCFAVPGMGPEDRPVLDLPSIAC